ncbi:MAG TPA: hypothetical protein PLL75_04700 [Candidatus Omnitrophota bacterium]|nr:hypothetical protein [Candidatus Omnitrophota bacterium]HPS37011.1 hypothetical protein [Candidatus Omnitrophota bacterium]
MDFKHPIGNIVTTETQIIVRFELMGDEVPDEGIICLNQDGKQIWKVEDPDMWRVGHKVRIPDQFGGVGFDKEGNLWAGGRQSRYRIDINTGKILEEEYTK